MSSAALLIEILPLTASIRPDGGTPALDHNFTAMES